MDIPAVMDLAHDLMAANGVGDWDLGLDRARRRAGQTDHTRRRITLSRALMELYSPDEVRETVLHEIAHARVGAAHGFGDELLTAALERTARFLAWSGVLESAGESQ